MSGEAQSSAEDRFMSRATAVLSEPGGPDDLQNVNTFPLPAAASTLLLDSLQLTVLPL